MDRYTHETSYWLDLRFDPEIRAAHGLPYESFQPVHGIRDGDWNPELFLMAARWGRLFHQIETLKPESFLDVGGAEGLSAHLVRKAFGIVTASADLSSQACQRAREFFDLPSVAVDGPLLPFPDDAFDVVFMSEVVEHLSQPVRSLLELKRVARRAVILTTEAFAPDEDARSEELEARRLDSHMDRSIICPDDLRLVLAPWNLLLTNHCALIPEPLPGTTDAIHEAITENLRRHDLAWPAHGLYAVACADAVPVTPGPGIGKTVDLLFEHLVPAHRERQAIPDNASVPEELLERLVCPITRGPLNMEGQTLQSPLTSRSFPVHKGVPLMHPERDEPMPTSLEECLRISTEGDRVRTAALLELDRKLAFDLPEPVADVVFLTASADGWDLSRELQVSPLSQGGLAINCPHPDAQLVSPRLNRPLGEVSAVTVTARALADPPRDETMQVFFRTLKRPAWWEPGSSTAILPMDGAPHRLEFPVPSGAGFSDDDELISIRLDPCHEPATIEIHRLEIR